MNSSDSRVTERTNEIDSSSSQIESSSSYGSLGRILFGPKIYSQKYLTSQSLPKFVGFTVLAVCILPFLLNLIGIDFGSAKVALDVESLVNHGNHKFHLLGGAFTHALLEWAAVSVAFLTVILAFTHFAIKKDPITPIIAVALLSAGFMDAFHTLAATRLIEAAAPNRDLIPFTWALCRLFNSLICLAGVSLFFMRRNEKARTFKSNVVFVLTTSFVFLVLAYITIYICAGSSDLPRTTFPDNLISRPWDVYPFFVFLITAVAYKALFMRQPGPFVYSLLISTIPDIAVQLHMALGSTTLFDNHFNIAHFLKIISYLVPFIGLAYEYIQTFKTSENLMLRLKSRNQELDDFTYIASHDLKEPLRGIKSNAAFLLEDYEGEVLDAGGVRRLNRLTLLSERMEALISSLLSYSKVDKVELSRDDSQLGQIISDTLKGLEERVAEENVQIRVDEDLPNVNCDRMKLIEVYTNLISNGIKYNKSSQKVIEIGVNSNFANQPTSQPDVFYVRDNGIGIPQEHSDSVFTIFKRLHAKDLYGGGSGAGLTIVKKIVEQHKGKIWVDCDQEQGSTFYFTLGGEK